MKTGALLLALAALPLSAGAQDDFQQCLAELRGHAAEQGVTEAALARAFGTISQQPRVLELDAKQPEFYRTFWQYLDARVTDYRVQKGRQLLSRHRRLLERIHADFGVRPEYLIAFWGLETNYGGFLGETPVLSALATLACDTRRADFFRGELIEALTIVDRQNVEPARMVGSWAGAMGHTQFMPSTYTRYAIDYDDADGPDLWESTADALASGANYLSAVGWRDGERWGREVSVPKNFDWRQAGLDSRRPLAEWAQLGVRTADGGPLPEADMEAALILPQGHRGPAFLVYDNFHVILKWNRSINYAISVGHLADRIAGMGELKAEPPANQRALTRGDVEEIQTLLAEAGLDVGEVDGVVGRQTREATRAFQDRIGVPADGYPDHQLLEQLRERAPRPSI